ncbi:NAD(P)/FAD-dependent oxidoreductase [Streptomyces sp. NPDC058659]|uniref:NAD(P)/FAD-dependent oxidoreductase n=1 Tax=unclassified Streptomyces TaxID=2593676 RepID=UPI0036697B19
MTGNIAVVVIGGGYAGVMAANRLTQRDDVTVTLINPRPDFVERIRLHQLVGGSDDAVVAYTEVLHPGIGLLVDSVTRIDAAGRSVTLATGGTVRYDYLVYAVGSGSADPRVPGAAEFAYPIADLEEAQRLRPVLDAAPLTAPVTVVGGGPTGIETAAELAEAGRAVTLVCGRVLGPYLHRRGRRSVAGRLAALGVTVVEGPGAKVTAVTRDAVRLDDGRELPSAVTIWTAGFGVPDLAARSGLSTDALGRLLTDETLTSVDDDRVIAAGDSAAPSNLPARMSCQAATPMGARAADTVLSRIAGETPSSLNQVFAGQCISLGRGAGIFQFAHRNDVALWFHIGGRTGAKVKEIVCKGTVKHLAAEAGKPGAYGLHRVSGGGQREKLLRAERDRGAQVGHDLTPTNEKDLAVEAYARAEGDLDRPRRSGAQA